jgi:Protein of unknown function (DUF2911)
MSNGSTARRLLFVLFAATPAVPLGAQVKASERGSVSQTVDGTVITVDYSRPQVRGRQEVFGNVVRAGDVWTPGANWATTLEVSKPIRLQGRDLAAGTYSMWMVTGPGDWTVYLHRNPRLFHTNPPRVADMLLSFPVRPTQVEHTELITFDFPRVAPDSTTLRFRWATTALSMDIVTQATRP